jgi:ribose transport system substrate-binding protein
MLAFTRSRGGPLLCALLLVASLALAACGSSSDSDADSGTTAAASTTAGGGGDAGVAESTTIVEQAYEGGLYSAPPTRSPRPAAGRNVWIVSAWQQVTALADQADRVSEAARKLGWTTDVCDGRNNENGGWAACIRQATAAGADGIVLLSVDCAPIRQGLAEAKRAGVKIASFSGFDCDDPTQGASEPLFDAPSRHLRSAGSIADWYEQLGRLRANVVIDATDGDAKIVHVSFQGISFGEYVARGFKEELAEKCPRCEIVSEVRMSPTDVPNIRQKLESALVRAPQANTVAVDVDYFFVAGVQPALVAANRPDLFVMGGECNLDDLGYLRSGGGEDACIGTSNGYRAYATVDALNRAFAGEPVVPGGAGFQVVDSDRNLPPEGEPFDGPVDYVSLYERAWGV